LGHRLKFCSALVAVAVLTACPTIETQRNGAASAQLLAPGTPAVATTAPEYTLAGHLLRLVVTDTGCVVEHRAPSAETRTLALGLRPPCHLLTWQRPPPTRDPASSTSAGAPIGTIGQPMAWQYADASGVIALAVIGDPVPDALRESSLYRLRAQQGLQCAASIQGILLRGGQVQLSKKREHVGVFCAELGLEEKDFWSIAHP
jgi:hypothetical protein